jgi:EpsI family protein
MDQGPVLPTGLVAASARYAQGARLAGMHVAAGWGNDPRNTVFSYNTTGRLGGNRRWNVVEERIAAVGDASGGPVLERIMTDGSRKLVLWQWFRVGGVDTANLVRAKAAVALTRLQGTEAPGVVVTLYAEYSEDAMPARDALASFRGAIAPVVDSWIQR